MRLACGLGMFSATGTPMYDCEPEVLRGIGAGYRVCHKRCSSRTFVVENIASGQKLPRECLGC